MILPSDEPETLSCSRAGCRTHAAWRIDWRNPKIHAADRRKTWLACDEHVDFLREFLAARDFPLVVRPAAGEAASTHADLDGAQR